MGFYGGSVLEQVPHSFLIGGSLKKLQYFLGKLQWAVLTILFVIIFNFFLFRILPGDRVKIELSPYDLDRGRITYRYK